MAMIEQRLLDRIGLGTANGPTFRTRRISVRSGIIYRNPVFAMPLYRYTILYRNLTQSQHEEVVAAFNACLAGVHSFRIKDYQDYSATDELLSTVATGSSQQIQLTKTYTFGGQSTERNIRKPVAGTVQMTANGSPISVAVDTTTGIVTLTATAGAALRWSGEFDVPVMFEEDELPFSGDNKNVDGLILTGNVPLVEDRYQ